MVHALLERGGHAHDGPARDLAAGRLRRLAAVGGAAGGDHGGRAPADLLREPDGRVRALAAGLAADGRAAAAARTSGSGSEDLEVTRSTRFSLSDPSSALRCRRLRAARPAAVDVADGHDPRHRGGGHADARGLHGAVGAPGRALLARSRAACSIRCRSRSSPGSLVLGVVAGRPRAAAVALLTMVGAGVTTQMLKPLLAPSATTRSGTRWGRRPIRAATRPRS